MALIMRCVRLSALLFCISSTAQMAAGNQPISVICSKRHIIPLRILPLRKKESQGSNMAMSVMVAKINFSCNIGF